MTPSEVKRRRLALNMSPLEFGIALGLGGKPSNIRNQVCKWERDISKKSHMPIPAKYELILLRISQ